VAATEIGTSDDESKRCWCRPAHRASGSGRVMPIPGLLYRRPCSGRAGIGGSSDKQTQASSHRADEVADHVTSAVQLWSQHGTDVAVGAALLLLLVLLGWAGRRKARRNRPGETRKERSPGVGAEEGATAAAHAPTAPARAPTAPDADLAPDTQALLDKAARLVDSHVLGTAQTLPMTPAPSAADCREPDPSATAAVRVASESDGSGPTRLPPSVVEELPAAILRPMRETPRVPTAAVGSSIGAYRLVRPSEPEVLTPPPAARAPEPAVSRPGLSLGTRSRRGMGAATPVALTRLRDGDTDLPGEPPEPRTPGGTLLGLARPAK
jgi:hypothetical protein